MSYFPKTIPAIILFLLFFNNCLKAETLEININPNKEYQTIENFTASDAWSGNFVGKYWGNQQKEQVAKWLFSTKTDSLGNPQGIGLSMWRVNLGAGTLEQDSADIMPYQRRAESFLTKDGSKYDWDKCQGQQYFMQKAKEYGCNNFLFFSNSPLVQYTKNGKGWSDSFSANLKPQCYKDFAEYLAIVIKHFTENKGYNISYISPINEPQVNWINPRQEGSPWKNTQMKDLICELNNSLSSRNLKTKILVGESSNINQLFEDDKNIDKLFSYDDAPYRQIETFFSKDSKNYIGNLSNVAPVIAGHAYWSHHTNKELKEKRLKLKNEIDKYNIIYQQTEWCMLPGLKDPMDGFPKGWERGNHTNINVALLMGRIIYGDMVYANATGWGYWKGMELDGNHALISLFANEGNIENGGNVYANKLLWALGNYSLFIRPGYKRIDVSGTDNLNDLVASAYISNNKDKIVIVCVNSSFKDIETTFKFPSKTARHINGCKVFCTSSNMDLACIPYTSKQLTNNKIIVKGRSLTTIVFDL